jgi:hypothetical protein
MTETRAAQDWKPRARRPLVRFSTALPLENRESSDVAARVQVGAGKIQSRHAGTGSRCGLVIGLKHRLSECRQVHRERTYLTTVDRKSDVRARIGVKRDWNRDSLRVEVDDRELRRPWTAERDMGKCVIEGGDIARRLRGS